jgi:hypothetical protein
VHLDICSFLAALCTAGTRDLANFLRLDRLHGGGCMIRFLVCLMLEPPGDGTDSSVVLDAAGDAGDGTNSGIQLVCLLQS